MPTIHTMWDGTKLKFSQDKIPSLIVNLFDFSATTAIGLHSNLTWLMVMEW